MISTHILDTSLGHPAQNVIVTLEVQKSGKWKALAKEKTNADGRISFDVKKEIGIYRLTFFVQKYFQKNKTESFFNDIPVAFEIRKTDRKYHVPLLLNPYGYSTYRGS